MWCAKCGNQLNKNDLFCSKCGEPVPKTENDSTTTTINENLYNSDNTLAKNIDNPYTGNEDTAKNNLALKVNKIIPIALFIAGLGVALFIGIVLISLMGWGKVYLFGGYPFTKTLATISLILMIVGSIALVVPLIIKVTKQISPIFNTNKLKILTILILTLSIILSIWGFVDLADNQPNDNGGSYGDSSGGSYGGSYGGGTVNSGISKSLGLSLKVDRIETSGSYTYVYCTVKNVSSSYGTATRYRYVKVKAQFKDYSGSIVDTDWTYAVDSTWLEPGESKTFYYMVKNTKIKSATLSFVD